MFLYNPSPHSSPLSHDIFNKKKSKKPREIDEKDLETLRLWKIIW
jgi:hypothetical protein